MDSIRVLIVVFAAVLIVLQATGNVAHSDILDLQAQSGLDEQAVSHDVADASCLAIGVKHCADRDASRHHSDFAGEACCGFGCNPADKTLSPLIAVNQSRPPLIRDHAACPAIADLGLATPPPDTIA